MKNPLELLARQATLDLLGETKQLAESGSAELEGVELPHVTLLLARLVREVSILNGRIEELTKQQAG